MTTMQKVKLAVTAASDLWMVKTELLKVGFKDKDVTVHTEMICAVIVETPDGKIGICSENSVSNPDFVINKLAIGFMT
jgi:hypothetical protein